MKGRAAAVNGRSNTSRARRDRHGLVLVLVGKPDHNHNLTNDR